MTVFTRDIDLVWHYSDSPNYQFDRDGNCYNVKTGRQLKRTVIGYTEGYCLKGKFKSLKVIREKLIKIEDNECPF